MKEGKVLVIDDLMHLQGSRESKYGRLSEYDLAVRIKSFFSAQGFETAFAVNGEQGLEIVRKDTEQEIKMVLLDLVFENTEQQGPQVFREILQMRGDLPVVVITQEPTRKLPQREDVFKTLVELGADLYIEKRYFSRRGQEQLNYVNAVLKKEPIDYRLRYREGLDAHKNDILDVDILREENNNDFSILKSPYRIPYPMCNYVEDCILKFPNPVHWTTVPGVNELTDTQFHKNIHKINDSILRSSAGRIPNLLERQGRTGCRINPNYINEIKKT